MRKLKKWSELTPKQKKNAKIIIWIAIIIILVEGISSLDDPAVHKAYKEVLNEKKENTATDNNSDKSEDQDDSGNEDYIEGFDSGEMEYQLKKEGYRIDHLESDNILVSCQPNNSYGQNFTDRIMLYSDAIVNVSAIRIESTTDGRNIDKDEDAKQHYYWIGSYLENSYHKHINNWIKANFNKKQASMMLDKYTRITIYAFDKTTRRMDIYKVNDDNKTSPIPDDQLFGY
jgi:hypothetical protein